MRNSAYETFVVRIYRRDPDDGSRLSGIVESAERGTRAPFDGADALLAALSEESVNAGSRHRSRGKRPPFPGG